jgi:hypothetical protein
MRTALEHAKQIGLDPSRCTVNGKPLAEAEERKTRRKTPPTPQTRKRTATEKRYARFLDEAIANNVVEWWRGEPFTITLAPKTTYRPDFLVALVNGPLCVVEIKGIHVWEDGVVKFKIARELRPEFVWICVRWLKGKWVLKYKSGREPLELIP